MIFSLLNNSRCIRIGIYIPETIIKEDIQKKKHGETHLGPILSVVQHSSLNPRVVPGTFGFIH